LHYRALTFICGGLGKLLSHTLTPGQMQSTRKKVRTCNVDE